MILCGSELMKCLCPYEHDLRGVKARVIQQCNKMGHATVVIRVGDCHQLMVFVCISVTSS